MESLDWFVKGILLGLLIFTLSKVKSVERTVDAMATAMQVEVKQ